MKNDPAVYSAVRAVATMKPQFQGNNPRQCFVDSLDVRGTAFWLKEYRVLITCAHVVRGLADAPLEIAGLLVVGNHGNYQRASISMVDYAHDLAVLRLMAPAEMITAESQTGLLIADDYPAVGDDVCYAGFPMGNVLLSSTSEPTYAKGVVGNRLRHDGMCKKVQISGPVIGGYSGAPIVKVDCPERVIAIVAESPNPAAGQANIFMGASWEHIRAIAEAAK